MQRFHIAPLQRARWFKRAAMLPSLLRDLDRGLRSAISKRSIGEAAEKRARIASSHSSISSIETIYWN